MSENLIKQRCKPCEGGTSPLSAAEADALLDSLDPGWVLSDDGLQISRRFEFPAYSLTLGFTNAVAWIAISEDHHPELTVNYGSCEVSYTTHAIGGLSANDFICAAKIDQLWAQAGMG